MRALFLSALLTMTVLAGCLVAPEATLSSDAVVTAANPKGSLDFEWEPKDPRVGDAVSFIPRGTLPAGDAPSSWAWTLGDGVTSTASAVQHKYSKPGLYDVTVEMRSENGLRLESSHVVAVVAKGAPPVADPEAPVPEGDPVVFVEGDGLTYRFRFEWDAVPERVGWDFGDGTTSSEWEPVHTYQSMGDFEVRLNVILGEEIRGTTVPVEVTSDVPLFRLSSVGRDGPEPSVGVTSDGCIFFAALSAVMRSCDYGDDWRRVDGTTTSPVSFDPYLWVDRDTDRIFDVQMIHLVCTWISWSDDGGQSWLGNPLDCGSIPVNDHIKLATGPWRDNGELLGNNPVYPNAVYFCYNKLVGVYCATSFDGGATFPLTRPACNGGLHGAIEVARDGTVYVPPRAGNPRVCISQDNGATWTTRNVDQSYGAPEPRKNPEVATDSESNAYYAWADREHRVRVAASMDGGNTWSKSVQVSPPEITSATFVQAVAGDPGRVAVAYLGSTNTEANPHHAPADARYDLYVSMSLNALSPNPVWTTVQVTEDPVQIGSICLNSGDCSNGNRNLLDFNDMHIGPDGRIHIAFADGCTGSCAEDPENASPAMSRSRLGMLAILESGPSLYDVELQPLP